ncbi:MAG: ATP synthase F1 subunit delta [Defluviitaleaceae bacterium]|nr:ATP synthase F1 subunit delta [Defluviitaleaceae bacterium]
MADLSKRYASALFELSAEQNLMTQYLFDASFMCDALRDKECKTFVTHPRVTGAEKIAFFESIFGGHIQTDLMGFLHLVVNKNREAFLLPALGQLIEMIRRHQNQITAKVVSAVPLTDVQLSSMAALLTRKFNKKVDIQVLVDPAVIGGISIQADGFFVDRTIRFQLRKMKEEVNQTVKKESGT